MKFLPLLCLLTVFLTGCVSRDQADAKLGKACQETIQAFLDDGYEIQAVKNTKFSSDTNNYRIINLDVLASDGWVTNEETYTCHYIEDFGFFSASHSADIERIEFQGNIIGKKDGKINGNIPTIQKLNNVSQKALR